MRLRKIIIILIKLPAKSCGMKHHLKFDLEKCYTSSSAILSLQREISLSRPFFDFGVRTEGGS